jgi:hypothetical protein
MQGRTPVLFAALLCGSCNQQDTGPASGPSGRDITTWMTDNPVVSEDTWAKVQTLNCQVSSGQICGLEGCKSAKPVTSVRWHPNSKKYQRCGGNAQCDDYTAQVAYSGSWANISVPERSMLARLTASGQFVEVVTQMDSVYVYHGQCQPMR